MSAELKPDLQEVKTLFKNFRARRVGNQKPRLPEQLWGEAIALLERYPFSVVCRELRLKANYLRQRAEAARQGSTAKFKLHRSAKKPGAKPQQDFLSLTAGQLSAVPISTELIQPDSSSNECRVMIERRDGSRLQITVPMDWSRLETLCAGFLRG
jgi:hypothetical protein